MKTPFYKRIVLKVSGEAMAGKAKFGIDPIVVGDIAKRICQCQELGIEVAIVVGGGNFWRGRNSPHMNRTRSDHMGMVSTVINSLALLDAIEKFGVACRIQTSIEMRQVAELYIRAKAVRHLEKKRVVIFACGTGNPFFSTDTAASLRAAEIGAEAILLAKNIDGVYDYDPLTNKNAKKFLNLSYIDIINKHLGVMDTTAASLCMDNKIPICVFAINDPQNIIKVAMGEKIGTIIN